MRGCTGLYGLYAGNGKVESRCPLTPPISTFRTAPEPARSRLASMNSKEDVLDELIDRASLALSKAKDALAEVQREAEDNSNTAVPSFIPSVLTFGAPIVESTYLTETRASPPITPTESEIAVAQNSVEATSVRENSEHWSDEISEAPTMILQRQRIPQPARKMSLEFAEPSTVTELTLPAQDGLDSARNPPQHERESFNAVQQLTFAHMPPSRQGESSVVSDETADGPSTKSEVTMRGESAAGHTLEDGKGTLADGSTWERVSGEEVGENGYWCRWWVLRGTALGGRVEWEETWWESSDWSGMREMGAQKAGCNVSGDAWREAWKERVYHVAETGEPCVERNAHKWAKDEVSGEQWEEKWGEFYAASGGVNKWAEKWGKRGSEVWHEKWGEDYEKGGDACVKWTDRWSEMMIDGGGQRLQGDKWREEFSGGTGNKTGETWYQHEHGHRYQRWWGENHFGDGWVQKFGHSTAGEQWDSTAQTGTYYNPSPHFTFQMALDHSPDLLEIPVRPREATMEEFMAGGIDNF